MAIDKGASKRYIYVFEAVEWIGGDISLGEMLDMPYFTEEIFLIICL